THGVDDAACQVLSALNDFTSLRCKTERHAIDNRTCQLNATLLKCRSLLVDRIGQTVDEVDDGLSSSIFDPQSSVPDTFDKMHDNVGSSFNDLRDVIVDALKNSKNDLQCGVDKLRNTLY